MSNLLLIALCLIGGSVARMTGRFPRETPGVLGRLVIDFALPSLTLLSVRGIQVPSDGMHGLLVPILMPWAQFLFAAGAVVALGRGLRWERGTVGALVLTVGLGNTSFVGFPMVEALYGKEGLATAVVVDQSSFLVLSTFGIIAAPLAKGAELPTPRKLARRLLTFPPFLAFAVALASRPYPLPAVLTPTLERLGGLVVPLALISVGFQLRVELSLLRRYLRRVLLGLSLKLVVWPALVWLVIRTLLHQRGLLADVTITEAAMAPMVTASVLATEADLDPELASLMVGLGVPLSLVTVLAFHCFL